MKIGSVELDLLLGKGHYNDAGNNERMVEVPLAGWFLKKHNYDPIIIEVGAVTPYYFDVHHSVFDIYDEYKGCIRIHAEYLNYVGKILLSISTIEHVCKTMNYNEPIGSDDDLASIVLLNMMKAKEYLITFPRRFNEHIDEFAEQENEHVIKLKRVQQQTWERVSSLNDVWFNMPYSCGNGLYIVTNCKELLERIE